jgi:hypothetical protein
MSEWYEADDADVSIDISRKEVDIFVTQNYHGSVYVSLKFDQIKKLAASIEGKS